MTHHLVSKMVDALYQVTYSGAVVECWSGEVLRELALLDLLREGRPIDLDSWSTVTQQFGLSESLMDQFVEDVEVGRCVVLWVALQLHWIVLKGYSLGQELLVEQSQPLLLLEDILPIESHLFSFGV